MIQILMEEWSTPILQYSILLDFRFVNVTPAPILAGLEGLDDR
jgi:hypothetical protein